MRAADVAQQGFGGKMRVLCVTYGGGHAHMIYPVVHALQQRAPDVLVQVLALPAATSTLRRNGINCLGLGDFLDPVADADAVAWGKALAEIHHSPTIGVALEDSIAYLGLNYKDLVLRHGEDGAQALMATRGRQAFLPLTVMERVFDRLQPDFVVTSNSPRSEAAAIEIANRRGIDNLIMTDLFTGLGDYQLKGRTITFLNEFARDMFAADGLVDDSISELHCTGNPAFDKILALPRQPDRAWLDQQFIELGGRKVVLHADMPAYWDPVHRRSHFKTEAQTLEELEACYGAAQANQTHYLVRPHPSQDRAFYAQWVQNKPHISLAADCDLHTLLVNVDLMVARTTTVGLEAAMLGVRILQLDADFHTDLPLATMGIAWGVNGYERLADAMATALADEEGFHEIRKRMVTALPTTPAATKIADIILSKLRQQTPARAVGEFE
jgi:hypothetical protein